MGVGNQRNDLRAALALVQDHQAVHDVLTVYCQGVESTSSQSLG